MINHLFVKLLGFALSVLLTPSFSCFALSLEERLEMSDSLTDSEDDFPIATPIVKSLAYDHLRQENIEGVLTLVDSHIKSGTPAHKIAVVFDVDGTITAHSSPGNHPTQDRFGATDIILKLMDMGVNVTISSAWNVFPETLTRLDDLQLTKVLNIHNRDGIDHGVYKGMNYYHLGNVAAVQNTSIDVTYFRQKAWAPYLVHGPDVINGVEKVIFADDSLANIRFFKGDVHFNELYPNATQFDYFLLTTINGIPKNNVPIEIQEDTPPTEEEQGIHWPSFLTGGKDNFKMFLEKFAHSFIGCFASKEEPEKG